MPFSQIVNLQFDSLLYSQIVDFYPIADSSYIMTDGACIYRTDHTGVVRKVINNQGHGGKEYLRIGRLYSDGKFIYAWCEMSLFLYKYDMNLNYIDKFEGPKHAVSKFVVKGDTAYLLLAGGQDEVVGVLPLAHGEAPSLYGCYTNEDKALLVNRVSGGITVYDDQIYYVKPSEMKIYTGGVIAKWTYEDKDFLVAPVIGRTLSRTPDEMLNYILANSTCSGLYTTGKHLWLITETGSIKLGKKEESQRYLNLFNINKDGKIVSSFMYNHPGASKYLVHDDFFHCLFDNGDSYVIKLCPI